MTTRAEKRREKLRVTKRDDSEYGVTTNGKAREVSAEDAKAFVSLGQEIDEFQAEVQEREGGLKRKRAALAKRFREAYGVGLGQVREGPDGRLVILSTEQLHEELQRLRPPGGNA